MNTIKCNAIITSIRSKRDGSLGLSIETPELSNSEKVLFMELQGLNSDLTITPLDSTTVETTVIDKDTKSRTPSERMRAVLFLLWKQEGEQDFFDNYYKIKLENLIDMLKEKIQ